MSFMKTHEKRTRYKYSVRCVRVEMPAASLLMGRHTYLSAVGGSLKGELNEAYSYLGGLLNKHPEPPPPQIDSASGKHLYNTSPCGVSNAIMQSG